MKTIRAVDDAEHQPCSDLDAAPVDRVFKRDAQRNGDVNDPLDIPDSPPPSIPPSHLGS